MYNQLYDEGRSSPVGGERNIQGIFSYPCLFVFSRPLSMSLFPMAWMCGVMFGWGPWMWISRLWVNWNGWMIGNFSLSVWDVLNQQDLIYSEKTLPRFPHPHPERASPGKGWDQRYLPIPWPGDPLSMGQVLTLSFGLLGVFHFLRPSVEEKVIIECQRILSRQKKDNLFLVERYCFSDSEDHLWMPQPSQRSLAILGLQV